MAGFLPRHRGNDFIEVTGGFFRADLPSGFLEPLGLLLVANLRLLFLLFACFSLRAAQ
jgi:hypothetical protein